MISPKQEKPGLKHPYIAPRLRVYGGMQSLTAAGSGNMTEGGMGMSMNSNRRS